MSNKLTKHKSKSDEMQNLFSQLLEPFADMYLPSRSGTCVCDWAPKIDIKDEEEHYLITADIPGVHPEDIKIHMDDGVLVIRGEKEKNVEKATQNYVMVERETGSFMRRFTMPEKIEVEKIKAKIKHGVLEVVIPKAKASATHKVIRIETEE